MNVELLGYQRAALALERRDVKAPPGPVAGGPNP